MLLSTFLVAVLLFISDFLYQAFMVLSRSVVRGGLCKNIQFRNSDLQKNKHAKVPNVILENPEGPHHMHNVAFGQPDPAILK
jgi:hypothetical protein